MMYKSLIVFVFLSVSIFESVHSLSVSPQDAMTIGEKIWKNECGGTIEGLTNWKKGENFASFGIGHFIWYTADKRELFQETFPEMIQFIKKNGASVPEWLNALACPWDSREAFYEAFHDSKMKSLRQFLFDTRNLQALYMARRLENALPSLLNSCSQSEKEKILVVFSRLFHDPKGLYALLDYLNFKGAGTSLTESYQGEGWGLLQVLKRIPLSSKDPLLEFVEGAKFVLKQRITLSPAERHEDQWLRGWFNRIDTYF